MAPVSRDHFNQAILGAFDGVYVPILDDMPSSGVYAEDFLFAFRSNGLIYRVDATGTPIKVSADADLAAGPSDATSDILAAISGLAGSPGKVTLGPGDFPVSTVTLTSSLELAGAGKGATTLTALGGNVLSLLGTGNMRSRITIEDLTIDCDNQGGTSGIVMEWAEDVTIRRVEVKNFLGWGMAFGALTNGSDTGYRIKRLRIEDCDFFDQDAATTLEALLLFNAQTVEIANCHFRNGTLTTGNGLGLYQVLDNIKVDGTSFEGYARGAYYSLSADNFSFRGCDFRSNTSGLIGANQSDNGTFSATVVRDMRLDGCTFYANTTGLQLGAVDNARVTDCDFIENIDNATVIDDGNSPVSAQPSSIKFKGCTWRDNNQSGLLGILHPGVLFQSVGGDQYVDFNQCSWYDTQGTPTQTHPITFTGAFTWNHIIFNDCRITPYSGAASVNLDSGAALDDDCQMLGCHSVGSTFPAKLQPVVVSNSLLVVGEKDTVNKVIIGDWGPNGRAAISLGTDDLLKLYAGDDDTIYLTVNDSDNALGVDDNAASNETAMLLLWNDGGTVKTQRVSVGASDSGGTGFRLLRLPNS